MTAPDDSEGGHLVTADPTAIRADGLTVRYRGKSEPALESLTIRIVSRASVGIAGPNGSGKTTFLRAAAGLLLPTAGSIRVMGFEVVREYRRALRHLGYVPEHASAYPYLSGKEFLRMLWELGGGDPGDAYSAATRALEVAGLQDMADRRIKTFSHGMLRRLLVAQGMIHDPDVLLMDEPFIGLDIEGIRRLRATLKSLHGRGKTVVMASHALSEFEDLCDYTGVFDRGHLVVYDRTEKMRSEMSSAGIRSQIRLQFGRHTPALQQFLGSLPFEVEFQGDSPVAVVTLTGAPNEFDSLLRALAASPEEVASLEPVRPAFERAVDRALWRGGP